MGQSALEALNALEKKGPELENPTAWLLGHAAKAGAIKKMGWETSKTIKKTVAWYNANGILNQELNFRIVSTALAPLKPKIACHILHQLEEKATELDDPNGWICSQARYALKDYTVKKMAYWLNTKGGLKSELHTDAIIWPLSQVELWQAKEILNELAKKKDQINNPTAWVNGWARKIKDSKKTAEPLIKATPKSKC